MAILYRSLLPALSILLFLLSSLVPPASAGEIVPELHAVLEAVPPTESLPVIVAFHGEADLRPFRAQVKALRTSGIARALRQTAEENQKNVRELLRGRGKKFADLWIINGLAIEADPELIRTLAGRPEVARIEPDRTFELPKVAPSQTGVQGNIQAVGAPDLWALGVTGQGVTVAILDSGVNVNHPDLRASWRAGGNSWFDPYLRTPSPYDPDPDGHGTLVTGVIVGGSASGTAIGVAPGANWIAAKIFRDDQIAENSRILQSFQWLLDPDGNPATADAPDVVNNSWGFEESPGVCDSFFRTAVQNLRAAGIAVVFSAGNGGPNANTAVSPANYPESFAVGSINSALQISFFSGRGPSTCDNSIYPEVVAPGENIRSSSGSGGYTFVSGTSFSAPHVSGVMALLLSAFGGTPPAQLEDTLKAAARDLGTPGPDNSYGFGLVNALAAFQLLDGDPVLTLTDSINPAEDGVIPFGSVAPGGARSAEIVLRNSGTGLLLFQPIGGLQQPFALAADGCSRQALPAGSTCTLTVRFAPGAAGDFSGTLTIPSNAAGSPAVIQLTGLGNTPPPPAQLIAPAAGARDLVSPVTFEWQQPPDADGDPLIATVLLSRSSDFQGAVQFSASAFSGSAALLASAGGLLLGGLAVGGRLRRVRFLLLSVAVLLVLWACGGGGSSEETTSRQAQVDANATYFWKVVTRDSRGGEVESEVRTFTTR